MRAYPITARLDPATHEKLYQIAMDADMTFSEVIRQRLKAGLPCNSCRPHSDGQPLHVALASELFAGCFDTMSIARQLAFSLSTGHEPADSVVLAAFEAARILELDTNALYRDMQSIPFFQR